VLEWHHITVPAVRPTGETTKFLNWSNAGPGNWEQTLTPPSSDAGFDFSGESVRATYSAGSDTCWFKGSAVSRYLAGSRRTAAVDGDNSWGPDEVGWSTSAVRYYRRKGRAPCAARFKQRMTIKSPSDDDYVAYGKFQDLGARITATTVTSIRAGSQKTIRR
jgi:hypothetical protein